MSETCGAVILAAGASIRLGQPKQLLKINGETLVRRMARFAVEGGCAPVCVVVGGRAELITPELCAVGALTVFNPGWQQGIGSSIRRGVESLLEFEPSASHIMILVCDQVRLSTDLLQQLRLASKGHASEIIASEYAGTFGVPAVFPREFFAQLQQLSGDCGAKQVMKEYPHRVKSVFFDGGAADLDTPEDYALLGSEYS